MASFANISKGASAGILGPHDVGGLDALINETLPKGCSDMDTAVEHWEKQVHSTLGVLAAKGMVTVDEMRFGIEQMPNETYNTWSYYEKWAASLLKALQQRGYVSEEDVEKHITGPPVPGSTDTEAFAVGTLVRVREEDMVTRFRRPHLRTPGYLFGAIGVITEVICESLNPELLALNKPASTQWLYRVAFRQQDLWENAEVALDTVMVEVYHQWLEPAEGVAPLQIDGDGRTVATEEELSELIRQENLRHLEELQKHAHGHGHSHSHGHSHGADASGEGLVIDEEDHSHDTRVFTELRAIKSEGPETPGRRVALGYIKLVLEKGFVTAQDLARGVETFEMDGASKEGARIVAKAWTDPEFKALALKDGHAAAAQLGIPVSSAKLVICPCTDLIHCMVVCTLCSCYPNHILGNPPAWYKSRSYRARAVRQPRKLLAEEFGVVVPESKSVRTYDSTADCRYMVLPQRPAGTEDLTEEQLIELVTRDSMLGVAVL